MAVSLMAAMAIAQGAKGLADTVIGARQKNKAQAEFDRLTSEPIEAGKMASEYGRYLDTVMGGAGRAEAMGRRALERGTTAATEAASRTGDASSAMDVALKAARGEEELGLRGAEQIANAYQTVGGVSQGLLNEQRDQQRSRQNMLIGMAAGSAEAGRQQMLGGIGSLIDAGAYGLTKIPNKTPDVSDLLGQSSTGGSFGEGAFGNLKSLEDTSGLDYNIPTAQSIKPFEASALGLKNVKFGAGGAIQKTPSGYNHDNGNDLAVVDKRGNDTGIRIEGDEYILNSKQAETLKQAAMTGNKDVLMRAALSIFSQPQFR